MNKEKSAITFSKLAPEELKNRVKGELEITKEGGAGKYFGIPEHFGRRKKDVFTGMVDKIRQKAIGWSTNMLSTAGKMVMLKSVLAAMPSHTMSCFKLPMSVIKRIQSVLARFWWDSKPDKRRMAWISWDTLTKTKRDGGLGFRDIEFFNNALLGKISWRILIKPQCLLARMLEGKYCNEKSFLEVKVTSGCSHGWRGILLGRDLLAEHLGWAIGDGSSVKIWDDVWLSTERSLRPMGPATALTKDDKVSTLFQAGTREWDVAKVEQLLPEWKAVILSIKASKQGGSDRRIWLRNPTGDYTTRTRYVAAVEVRAWNPSVQREVGENSAWIKDIWSVNIPPKIKLLLWKGFHNALPINERLLARHIIPNARCANCEDDESILHLFFLCLLAERIWRSFPSKTEIRLENVTTFAEGWKAVKRSICLPPTGVLSEHLAAWTVWSIWLDRNQLIFRNDIPCARQVLSKAIRLAREWTQAQPQRELDSLRQGLTEVGTRNDIVCRSDAAWNKERHQAGVSWEFLSNVNTRICSGSRSFTNVKSPLVAEGLALLAAMEEAITLDFKQISFESDSSRLMTTIKEDSNVSDLHGILSNINSLSLAFVSVSFYWVSRSSVSHVDDLAKQVLRNVVLNPY